MAENVKTEASEAKSPSIRPEMVGEGASRAFRGSFEHSLDTKGRVSLPSTFRSIVGNDDAVVLTNFICDGARCLDGFALRDWEVFEAKLRSQSRFDPQLRKLENFYLARAVDCPVDKSGRINIPNNLRSYAGLDREVIFTSSFHGFRIWDLRVWNLIFSEAESALIDDPSLFTGVDVK